MNFNRIPLHFHLKTQCLLNAFSTLQEVMFSNWKTLLFAKSKTRSANIVFLNTLWGSKLHFIRIPLHFHCLFMLFLSAISEPQKSKFSH